MVTTEWFVVDTRTNEIVNCVMSTSKPDLGKLGPHGEHLRLETNPPMWMLEKYRYWTERP